MIKVWYHPLTAVIATVLVSSAIWSLMQHQRQLTQSAQTIPALQEEINGLQQDVVQLQTNVQTAQSEFAQERVVRDQLLMQKEGEVILQLPEVSVAAPSPSPTPKLQVWQEWQQVMLAE